MTQRLEIVIAAKDEFTRVFGGIQASLAPVIKGFAAAGAAATAFGAGVIAIAKTVADEQDQLSKLSDKLGLTVETLSRLKYAADLADVGLEGMGNSMQFMLRFAAEAAAGNEQNREALAGLGVELNRIKSQAPDQMFQTFAAAIASIENPAEKTRVAMEIFGRSGTEMIKMLKGGTGGLAELAAEAERFGVVVSTQAAYNAAEFNDSLTRVGASFRGVRNELAEQFLPILTGVFRNLAEWIASNRKAIVEWSVSFTKSMGAAMQAFTEFFLRVSDGFSTINALSAKFSFSSNAAQLKSMTDQAGRFQDTINKLNGRLAEMERVHSKAALEGSPAYDSVKNQIAQYETMIEAVKVQIKALNDENQRLAQDFSSSNAWSAEQARQFFDEITAGLDKLRQMGTAEVPEFQQGAGLEIKAPKGEKDKLEADIRSLRELWGEYYLSESERVDAWYAEQQSKFKGHKDELLMLEQVYQAKKTELRTKEMEDVSNQLKAIDEMYQQKVLTDRERLDAWYAEQIEKFSIFEETRAQIEAIYSAQKAEIEEAEEEKRLQLREKQLTGYSDMLGAMSTMATAFGKKGFKMAQSLAIVQAMIDAYKAFTVNLSAHPYPLGPILAAAAFATAVAQVAKIKAQKPPQAHTGLDYVPREQTYLLSKGERVVQPQANKDLTEFLQGGGGGDGASVTIDKLEVFPNVTDARALRHIDEREMEEIVEERIVPALRRLKFAGIKA